MTQATIFSAEHARDDSANFENSSKLESLLRLHSKLTALGKHIRLEENYAQELTTYTFEDGSCIKWTGNAASIDDIMIA